MYEGTHDPSEVTRLPQCSASREFYGELLGELSVSSFVNGVVIPLEYISRKYLEVKLTVPELTQQ